MAHPTEKLFVKCFQIELDFRSVVLPLRDDSVKKTNVSSSGFCSISVSKKTVILFIIISATIQILAGIKRSVGWWLLVNLINLA